MGDRGMAFTRDRARLSTRCAMGTPASLNGLDAKHDFRRTTICACFCRSSSTRPVFFSERAGANALNETDMGGGVCGATAVLRTVAGPMASFSVFLRGAIALTLSAKTRGFCFSVRVGRSIAATSNGSTRSGMDHSRCNSGTLSPTRATTTADLKGAEVCRELAAGNRSSSGATMADLGIDSASTSMKNGGNGSGFYIGVSDGFVGETATEAALDRKIGRELFPTSFYCAFTAIFGAFSV